MPQPPLPAGPGLLAIGAGNDYRTAVHQAVDLIASAIDDVEQPYAGTDPSELADRVARVDLARPVDAVTPALDELRQIWLDSAIWFHHPRYTSHLNCPVLVSAVAADAVASAVNTSVDTWDQSAAATHIERRLVRWTADLVGFGSAADGIFTSGGTASNQQALTIAREAALERAGLASGPAGIDRLRVLATDQSHFSVLMAARVLGLRPDAVITVPSDEHHRMDAMALDAQLDRLQEADLVPMAVVATAGTTDLGVIDPLRPVAEVCARHGAWMHVDAAYGGGWLTSSRHPDLLKGIDLADSVTIDFHKTWFQPVAASMVLLQDGGTLRHIAHHADYLNPVREDPRRAVMPDQVDKSLQTTRRFDALKLWMSLRVDGAATIGILLDRLLDLAAEVADLIEATPDLCLAQRPTLSTVLFRWDPPGIDPQVADDLCDEIVTRMLLDGRSIVARTRLDGRVWFKLTLLNPMCEIDDVRTVLDQVVALAAELTRDLVEVGA